MESSAATTGNLQRDFEEEVSRGQRFEFGKNWQRFLSVLDEERIAEAARSLSGMLGVNSLEGKTFLDIGSGSGLFSLAALRLGAARVYSFDYDPQSVACTRELKRRYFPDSQKWTVERGSALDAAYLQSLGHWDIVYSWGVLHHTGNMWKALDAVAPLVKPGGRLFISIYNDQGILSKGWRAVKGLYNRGRAARLAVSALFIPYFALRTLAADLIRHRNLLKSYGEYKRSRGMSRVHDWFDWIGGYPFEVAKPEEIFDFYHQRGFALEHMVTCGGGLGCNQFVFTKR